MTERPSWDAYFMKLAHLATERSTCLRRQVGAVLVKDNHVLATGYNGAPRGVKHCIEVGCLRTKLGIPSGQMQEICRGVHAEQNCITQAALHGITTRDSIVYTTFSPCSICSRLLINAGIKKVYFEGFYPDELSRSLLREARVNLCQFSLEKLMKPRLLS